MHEIRIAEDLARIVLDTASEKKLRRVTSINISFGQLVQIVPEIFEFAFREIVKDSVAQDALLHIETIKVKMKCARCGNDFKVEDNIYKCVKCGSFDLEIINGKELFIKSLEGE